VTEHRTVLAQIDRRFAWDCIMRKPAMQASPRPKTAHTLRRRLNLVNDMHVPRLRHTSRALDDRDRRFGQRAYSGSAWIAVPLSRSSSDGTFHSAATIAPPASIVSAAATSTSRDESRNLRR